MFWLIFIIAFLITMMVVVGIHEASHFAAAKLVGVKVLRFSIGFGKALFTFRDKSGTEYVFALIPLGGYVKMLGESTDDVHESEKHSTYAAQPYHKKAFIIAAGPLSNFVCAFLLYVIVYSVGFTTIKPIVGQVTPDSIAARGGLSPYQEITEVDNIKTASWMKVAFQLILHAGDKDDVLIQTKKTCGLAETRSIKCVENVANHQLDLSTWNLDGLKPDPFQSLGVEPYLPFIPLIIGQVTKQSPAEKAGFKVGDKLSRLNHIPMTSWDELAKKVTNSSLSPLLFEIIRNGKPITILVQLENDQGWFKKKQRLGIAPQAIKIPEAMLQKVHYSFLDSLQQAYWQCKELTYFNLIVFKKMFTGKLSFDSLGGPIAIFDTAGEALNQGAIVFLVFLAFMNLSIGLINLFPLPGLDGGHLLLQTIEFVIRRPIPVKLTEWLLRFSFVLLLLFFMRALFNDIMRLF